MMIEIRRQADRKELLIFAAALAIVPAFFAALLIVKSGVPSAGWMLLGVAACVWLIFVVAPKARLPIYVGWQYLFMPIGWLISHTLMALIYYGLVTPIGFMMRLFGYHPLQRVNQQSNWIHVERRQTQSMKRYLRQY